MQQVENLRCLRDPNCKKHAQHAGHLQKLKPIDPGTSYKVRQRRKRSGKQAWMLIRSWQKYHKAKLTATQRHSLFVFVRDALFAEHLFS